ncbi:c-type cytochrome [Falsirhodobacter algicola]|uniref:C-type cytochrome n=1 Tax=Falsirhodobacter algicola TaxID=2692330 RepID=A0A8J8MSH4_9RHOB|nr:cytochrome c family protein [Falsirhodobacter algicola]QUS35881.1 c-type cytochrome [Falsirhodobacter algicola]
MGSLTQWIAAGSGALLALLCLNWAAVEVYAPRPAPGQVPAAQTRPDPPAAPPPETLAAGDAERGRQVFTRCAACHRIGADGIGPHLDGVVGRPAASVPDYAYSGALRAMDGAPWTVERLSAFLANPRGFAPGTKMAFAGLPSAQDRADVIAYLNETR